MSTNNRKPRLSRAPSRPSREGPPTREGDGFLNYSKWAERSGPSGGREARRADAGGSK